MEELVMSDSGGKDHVSTVRSVRHKGKLRYPRGPTMEEVTALPLEENGVQQPPQENEGKGDDYEEPKRFYLRHGHHQGKFENVHQLVERVLHAVDNTSLFLGNRLQEQLGDGQICHPQTCNITKINTNETQFPHPKLKP